MKNKNYIRGIIFNLIPLQNREEVTNEIYEQTKDNKSIKDIEYITKGILIKYQEHKEEQGKFSRVSRDISEFIISQK